jgi:type IV secretion system protein VirB1
MSGLLSVVAALALAQQCAPGVAPETVVSIARTESGLNPLAIHDNTSGRSYAPESTNEATALAISLILGQRHSVDLGLMQVNSANLAISNLSIAEAFNACHSMEAGAHILAGAFRRALRSALSAYNTGDPQRGINNGYVASVEAAAVSVPAIVPATRAPAPPAPATQSGTPPTAGWDVFAQSGGTRFVFTSNGATANAW